MQHAPVILFLSTQPRERDAVDKWLMDSRYLAFEAADVFQALEHASDFTTGERPDVIFLHVDSVRDDLEFARSIVSSENLESDVPIIDFSRETVLRSGDKDLNDAIARLACRLDQYIPDHNIARA